MDRKAQIAQPIRSWPFWAAVIAGAALGVVLGLMAGWVWWPPRWIDVAPVDLQADYRDQYLLLVADRYAESGDLEWARTRLGVEPGQEGPIVEELERLAGERVGQEAVSAQALAAGLAADVPGTTTAKAHTPTGTPRTVSSKTAGTSTPTTTSSPSATPSPSVTPTPCGPWFTCAYYTVQPGDTIYDLASMTGLSADQLKRANCLEDDAIQVGQRLCLPFIPTPTPSPTPIPTWTPVPTPVPTSVPTRPPPPTITPTPVDTLTGEKKEIPDWLKAQVFFSPGGAGELATECLSDPQGKDAEIYQHQLDCLRLTGFPPGEAITVTLRALGGRPYIGVFRVETGPNELVLRRDWPPMTDDSLNAGIAGDLDDTMRLIAIPLWRAASLPPGKWYAAARSASGAFDDHLTDVNEPSRPAISIIPESGANPLQAERGTAEGLCLLGRGKFSSNLYSRGEWIEIRGIKFEPGVPQPLGIYYREIDYGPTVTDTLAVLTYESELATDGEGAFQTWVPIDKTARLGNYWVTFGEAECAPGGGSECEFTGTTGCFTVR